MPFRIFRVKGRSMHPALSDGDYVLCRGGKRTRYKVGDIVVAHHPDLNIIVKRIVQIDHLKGVLVSGDNPVSTASEHIGWMPRHHITGKVIFSA